jgi:serine/threonine protein kinase
MQDPKTKWLPAAETTPGAGHHAISPSRSSEPSTNAISPGASLTPSAPHLPNKVKPWSLRDKIGQGRHGVVYRCLVHDSRLGPSFPSAVKRVNLAQGAVVNVMELAIMRTLCHPHLNGASFVAISHRYLYLFQDEATTDLSVSGARSLSEWWPLLGQLVSALHCLHFHHIIHGDIKPANILYYASSHSIRLTDFTASRFFGDYHGGAFSNAYGAPEVLAGTSWNASADVWALGATIFRLVYRASLWGGMRPQPAVFQEWAAWYRETRSGNRVWSSELAWSGDDLIGRDGNSAVSTSREPHQASSLLCASSWAGLYTRPDHQQVDDLILDCCHPVPEHRLTTLQMLPYWSNDIPYGVHVLADQADLPESFITYLAEEDPSVANYAQLLYRKLGPLELDERVQYAACTRLARRMIRRTAGTCPTNPELLARAEQLILSQLGYRLPLVNR